MFSIVHSQSVSMVWFVKFSILCRPVAVRCGKSHATSSRTGQCVQIGNTTGDGSLSLAGLGFIGRKSVEGLLTDLNVVSG